jgi:ribonuclease HII
MQVCGIDEAGRGPIAGPVTAAAVVLPRRVASCRSAGCDGQPGAGDELSAGCSASVQRALFESLGDSKSLTPGERSCAAALIKEQALAWAVGWSWPEEIDRLNIHRATLLAMSRALAGIHPQPDLVLVDGLFVPECLPCARAVVRGDQTVQAIMAASILAKTERDLWMVAYAGLDPRYGFESHKGYATPAHRMEVERHGLCPIHRRSFRISCAG